MAADKALRMQPHLVGKQQNGEQHQRDQHKERLEGERGVSAQKRHHLREQTDDEQINASQQYRQRVMKNGVGRIDADFKLTGAQQRTQDQQACHGKRGGVDRIERQINSVKQKSLAARVRPDCEQNAQAHDHELDAPAHGADRGTEGPLEVHQHHQGANQQRKIQNDPRQSQGERQLRVRRSRSDDNQFLKKAKRYPQGYEECRRQDKTPTPQKFLILPAAVAQAEEKPDAGQKRHGHQFQRLPVDYHVRLCRARAQRHEDVLRRQSGHSGRESPVRERAPLPQDDEQCHHAAADCAGKSEYGSISHKPVSVPDMASTTDGRLRFHLYPGTLENHVKSGLRPVRQILSSVAFSHKMSNYGSRVGSNTGVCAGLFPICIKSGLFPPQLSPTGGIKKSDARAF